MHVMVFLDDARGMLFNHRRQSRDQALLGKIQQICQGRRLWMNPYSQQLYGDLPGTMVDEHFLTKAAPGEICLVETEPLLPVVEKIETLLVFWWNRKYPADFSLDLPLETWTLRSSEEFPGFSHETITLTIYEKDGAQS